eukprot:CAMPEP_0197036352 /NCGR_PEP_ID=MMETSP1384-20130603/13886_1 /TAXON_ID=29189 /ORGANISM="Ammonia sp." /LENGTH=772 /DNA_ID=CAMNT_0042466525 /DNA_START=81 /DNA_END=2399 /DNA_ORIENTATION=+
MADMNVRVCCRFRPVNKIETAQKGHKIVVQVASNNQGVVVGSGKKQKSFQFDYIFPPDSQQKDVFTYAAAPLVDQVLAGYNCTLFAYGQTGSGKTYSMEGKIETEGDGGVHEGLIPRMVRAIFDRILNDDNTEFEYTLRVSFVEIYNERLRDLLQPNGAELKIREKTTGARGVYIENVHAPFVASPEEVFDHLTNGHVNRSVASTRMNEHSSRSHAVFMLQLEARNTETGSSKASKLMLVDLAGSEKVRKTNATGQTLKEAQQINKSLMVLGLVINSLVENKKHVPYRDSKLTRLLSDALGGNSKTMLIVTASPSKYNVEETLSTLRFGQRAKSIKNEAKINQELSVAEYQKLLEKARKREEMLRSQIRSLQTQNDALIALCKENNIDISKAMHGANHASKSSNSTQALLTLVPKAAVNDANSAEHIKQIEVLQSKLDAVNDEKMALEELVKKSKDDVTAINDELNDVQRLYNAELNKVKDIEARYQEVWTAKNHLDKLFESLKSGDSANQNRFATEKLQWNEDKMQLLDEVRSKENRVTELEQIQQVHEQQIAKLREKIIALSSGQKVEAEPEDNDANNGGFSLDASPTQQATAAPMDDAKTKQKMIALLDTARKYRAQNEKYSEEMKKLKEKLKAYKRRDEVNKQLRENWNKQLNQMEQAVLLANEIYNRERTRHEAEVAEKDVEILKLRKFLLSFTNRHAKGQQRVNQNGVVVNGNFPAPKNNGNNLALDNDSNAPGARKSRIVKPKVIKAGAAVTIKPRGYNNNNSHD